MDDGPYSAVYYAGNAGAIFSSNDEGKKWVALTTLPRWPDLSQVEYVSGPNGDRFLHVTTWNWSAYTARLQ